MPLHHFAEKTADWLRGWRFNPIVVTPVFLILLFFFTLSIDPSAIAATFEAVVLISPIWLPIALAVGFWIIWIHYIRFEFWFSRETVLLEVTPPPEIEKSPLGMEIFLTGIYNTGSETTFIDRFWKGKFRPIFTLEIASNEGRISYYIHTMRAWKNAVEARLYGQFPEAKIIEVEDYVAKVPFNLKDYDLWGAEYRKTVSPQAFPIKTYLEYELNKDTTTPESKTDPLTNVIEIMNNMGKDEYIWMQIVMQAHTKEQWYGINSQKDEFREGALAQINTIMANAAKRAQTVLKESDIVEGKMNALLTDGERFMITALQTSMGKTTFDCGIRVVYVAKREKFQGINGAFMYRYFEQLRGLNGLIGTRGMIGFDYPWEDFNDMRKNHIKNQLFFHYKNRAYFYVPYDQYPAMLTTEEIATLWHFPSSSVKTPGLSRVPSRVSEAPSNLPVLPS